MTDTNQKYYGGYSKNENLPQEGYPPQESYPTQGGYKPNGGYPPGGNQPQPGFVQPPTAGVVRCEAYDDLENQGGFKNFSFSDESIRRGFIRKVYMILMVQLAITFGFLALLLNHVPTQQFIAKNPFLYVVALILVLVTIICIACCESVRRKSPMNFIVLGLFTLAESFLVGVASARFKSEEVLMAIGITALVCLALTIFAMQTKYDFTMCGGILLVVLLVFFVFGIVAMFFPGKILSMVYACFGALLFSIYLIYDTQLMMGGDHKYSMNPEEYIFAALTLYLDIINIFIYILSIIGDVKD